MRKGGFILFLLLCTTLMQGQTLIDSTQNTILNAENLASFYQKLAIAKRGEGNVHILHIGDSHIQAGFFSGVLREAFQTNYGNAGRGLTFPYRLAKTNGNMDVRFSSNVAWQRYRIITEDAPQCGIAGATVYSDAEGFLVKMSGDSTVVFNQIEIYGEGLDQVKLATAKNGVKMQNRTTQKIHVVKSGDVLGKIARKYGVTINQLKHWNHLKNTMIRIGQKLVIEQKSIAPTYDASQFSWIDLYEHTDKSIKAILPESTTEIYLVKEKQQQNKTVSLYSFHLRNSQQGVIYDAVGYNGAKYIDYLSSLRFFIQLEQQMKPDLIILSLGTNEAFDKSYVLENFRNDVELFCKEIEQRTGCNNILFTTPPSALVKRKYPNKKLSPYAQVLKDVAQQRKYAVWDLYEIMGAENGMKQWYKAGLSGNDRIHFREEGYHLQGKALYEAILKYAE